MKINQRDGGSTFIQLPVPVFPDHPATACSSIGHYKRSFDIEETDDEQKEYELLYLSLSKQNIRDDVGETAAQHQHHTVLTVSYTRNLQQKRLLGIDFIVAYSFMCFLKRMSADLCPQTTVRAHSAEREQRLQEGWG